jgi:hypothetical protein
MTANMMNRDCMDRTRIKADNSKDRNFTRPVGTPTVSLTDRVCSWRIYRAPYVDDRPYSGKSGNLLNASFNAFDQPSEIVR